MAHRIFLVDDEPFVVNALARVFKREGYEILTATDGKEALEKICQNPVDMIIADQRMPGMTGVELLKVVNKTHPNIIKIILSGYSDINEIISAINIGEIYRFITKPWDDTELLGIVKKALEQSETIHTFTTLFNKIVKNIDIATCINIETVQTGNNVRITLKDTTRSLSSDDITKLLEFLFSAFNLKDDMTTKLKFASGVIEKQKGKISLVTETNKGLIFTIELPVV